LSTTLSKIWLSVGPFFRSFDHNFLVSRPFLARKVSNRSSHHVLQNGQGAVSLIQLSVWSTIRSNLGQTWSNLVKVLQILGNVSRTTFRGFLIMVGLIRVGNGPVKLGQIQSNLVKPSQTWSTLVKFGQTLENVSWTFFLGVFDMARLRQIMLARSGLSRFAYRHPRKSRG
jgi:hypothetical protein